MKREILRLLAMVMVGSFFVAGCRGRVVVRERVVVEQPAEVIVSTEPPPPRHEVIGIAPSGAHVWIEGYWVNRNGRWVWIPGHWEVRPRTGAVWVPGHWERTSRGWVWRRGHWD